MSAQPQPNLLGSSASEAISTRSVLWSVSYTPEGFLMRRLEPKRKETTGHRPSTSQLNKLPQQAEGSELKRSLLASTPLNSSNDSSGEPRRSMNVDHPNSESELPSALHNKPEQMEKSDQAKSANAFFLPSKLPAQTKYIKVTESYVSNKRAQHESVSVSSKSQSEHQVKKKMQKMQSHILQIEQRQKKLQQHQLKLEQAMQKFQQRAEQLPPIRDPPKTVEVKKNSKTCRINSKLVSLTVQNTAVIPRKKTMDSDRDRDDLKKEIIELKDLIKHMKEDQLKRAYNSHKEPEAAPIFNEFPSIEGESIVKVALPQKAGSQFSGSPYPSKELPVEEKPKERITVGDMKTVFYNGAAQFSGTVPKTTNLNEQPSSDLDVQKDVVVPLNTKAQTGKNRNKVLVDNLIGTRRQDSEKYTNYNRPPFDTRYDTSKRMEHHSRANEAMRIDDKRSKLKSFNPEELDNEKYMPTKKWTPQTAQREPPSRQSPQKKSSPYKKSAERYVPREPYESEPKPQPQAKRSAFREEQQQQQQPQALDNAYDDIEPAEDMVEDGPGEISTIELAQFRTSEDLNKKLVVFPKLPGPLTPLLNSEELTNLAKQTFAVFGHPVAQNSALTIKKYRNCVYFSHQKKHILWHYSGKFYIGSWDANGKEEGCKSGRGIEFIPENYIYEGEFNNGKREGYGVVNSLKGDNYVGHWYQGLRHGKGRLQESSGLIYDGHWKHGKKDGLGRLTFQGLEVYQGGFEDGLKHGFGREQFRNKDTYKGQYNLGRFTGEGTYKWANGAVYQGQFLNGMRHGRGCWKSTRQGRSDTYEGDYFQDKKSGFGRYTWENGTIYEGRFLNDMKHGEGELRYPDGTVIQGIWERGTLKYETFNSKNLPPAPLNFREEPSRAVQPTGSFPF